MFDFLIAFTVVMSGLVVLCLLAKVFGPYILEHFV